MHSFSTLPPKRNKAALRTSSIQSHTRSYDSFLAFFLEEHRVDPARRDAGRPAPTQPRLPLLMLPPRRPVRAAPDADGGDGHRRPLRHQQARGDGAGDEEHAVLCLVGDLVVLNQTEPIIHASAIPHLT